MRLTQDHETAVFLRSDASFAVRMRLGSKKVNQLINLGHRYLARVLYFGYSPRDE